MPVIEGVQCYISTSTGKLLEYTNEETKHLDETSTGRVRSCYVQAQEDLEFKISVEPGSFANYHPEATDFVADFSLDGVRRKPKGSLARFTSKTTDYKHYVHVTDSSRWIQALKFEKLDITDDLQTLATQNLYSQKWGEIEVRFYRWRQLSERETTKHYRETCADIEQIPGAEPRKVHETELKGREISCAVGGGRLKRDERRIVAHGEDVDRIDGEPYMTFTFLYRSEHALKSLGLIPRTPSPPPTVANMDALSALSREELLARVVELESKQASASVKRERSENVTPVKAEHSEPKRSRLSKIIDLTDD